MNWTAGTVVAAAIGALILLSSLPLAQYVVLPDHVTIGPVDSDQYGCLGWRELYGRCCRPRGLISQHLLVPDLHLWHSRAVHGGNRCNDHRLRYDSALATVRRSKISILSFPSTPKERTRRDFTAQEEK
jgi:hypothetical protein